ncbi:MAG: hypothetical protein AAGC60_05325 [Acidobacteriota bacterium]
MPYANNIRAAAMAYPTTSSLGSWRSSESIRAATYLTNHALHLSERDLRYVVYFLLGEIDQVPGAVKQRYSGGLHAIPADLRPLKAGGRLHTSLRTASQLAIGAARSSHLVILLGGWDWVQLTNVHAKVAKHGDANVRVSTVSNATLPAALQALTNTAKIHVVGHGGPNVFLGGTSPTQLADRIHTDLPPGTTLSIRVDTCSSGVIALGNTAAGTIKARLVAQGRNAGDLTASGTTGASVTGVVGKRLVVDPAEVDTAAIIQAVLEHHVHKTAVDQARAVAAGLALGASSQTIKTAARQAWTHTQGFFADFEHLLNNWHLAPFNGNQLVLSHALNAHKVTS